jgi:hypothetical protein
VNKPPFILSRDDWSLHRKGELDQERHKRKVKETIREKLADLVSEESIILPRGDKVIKVPIRSLDEPKFRFNMSGRQQVGQGKGGTGVGDVIGKAAPDGDAAAGRQAGDQPGEDYYEAEITIDELAELVFEDLKLPRLKPKQAQHLTVDDVRFNDVRKQGMMSNVDKRRTLIESIKRRALSGYGAAVTENRDAAGMPPATSGASGASKAAGASGAEGFGAIRNEDLRFKTWEDVRKPSSNAVVLAMMDTSGSMGVFEKYIARSFFFWMTRFLRTRYENVAIRFLAHHTEAKEVDEDSFFQKGESGGTKCSSVYELALRIVDGDYPHDRYNVYAFHFSDGDNAEADNPVAAKLVADMLDRVNLFGYGEIRQYRDVDRGLWNALAALKHPSFTMSVLRDKEDVYRTLKSFFGDSMAG